MSSFVLHMTSAVYAIDLGGPVLRRPPNSTPEAYATAEETPGAFEALKLLNRLYPGRIHFISQCTPEVEAVKRRWLVEHRFEERTGIRLTNENLHFEREPHEKSLVCEEISATHFIDDRLDILMWAAFSVQNLYLFTDENQDHLAPHYIKPMKLWAEFTVQAKKQLELRRDNDGVCIELKELCYYSDGCWSKYGSGQARIHRCLGSKFQLSLVYYHDCARDLMPEEESAIVSLRLDKPQLLKLQEGLNQVLTLMDFYQEET